MVNKLKPLIKLKILSKKLISKGICVYQGSMSELKKTNEKIFQLGKAIAKKSQKKFGVITFSPLPHEFFQKNKKIIQFDSAYLKNLKN